MPQYNPKRLGTGPGHVMGVSEKAAVRKGSGKPLLWLFGPYAARYRTRGGSRME